MFLNLFKNSYKIMNKRRYFLSLVAAVLLASCAARTGMPEFSVFNMSDRNEAVRVSSEGMIDDVSISERAAAGSMCSITTPKRY